MYQALGNVKGGLGSGPALVPNQLALTRLHFPCLKKEGVCQAARHMVVMRVKLNDVLFLFLL